MEITLDAVPNQVPHSFKSNRENPDGSLDIISAKHPEIKSLQMNKVGRYVYERCNGINTVSDLLTCIMSDYKNVSYDKVKKDLFDILFLYWRTGFINWRQNPYEYFYKNCYDGYEFRVLTEDEAAMILAKVKESSDPNYDIKYDKKYALNERRIRQSIYLNLEQYAYILENNNLKFLICLKSDHTKKTSVELIVLCLSEDFADNKAIILEFVKWSAERFARTISKNIHRIDYYSLLNTSLGNIVTVLGFEEIGELKDSITIDGVVKSMTVRGLKLLEGVDKI